MVRPRHRARQAQYTVRGCHGRKILMHREIMQTPPGMVVDHVNRNDLDIHLSCFSPWPQEPP
jgi:hypothetical protein